MPRYRFLPLQTLFAKRRHGLVVLFPLKLVDRARPLVLPVSRGAHRTAQRLSSDEQEGRNDLLSHGRRLIRHQSRPRGMTRDGADHVKAYCSFQRASQGAILLWRRS